MRPLDYFHDTAAEGKGHYPQRFCAFFFLLVKVVFGALFRFKAWDACKVSPGEGLIIAGNHRSYLDPVFVMSALRPRPVRFMAKEEFFANPVIARLASWVGAYPVKRDTADLKVVKRSVAMLKRGELVGIFPEGTRGRDPGKPQELHEGVALIAHLARCKVVPVHIWGTDAISPPGSRRWHFPKVCVRFGDAMSLDAPEYQGMGKDERMAAFTADVMRAVAALERPQR
jgi:1-acyl-sn-glycerol-3-phosphate acyltransferase